MLEGSADGYLQFFSDNVSKVGKNVASVLGLTHLGPHLPTILASFVFWIVVQQVLSPFFSPLISSTYANESNKPNPVESDAQTTRLSPTRKANAHSNGISRTIRKRSLKGWGSHSVALVHALVVSPLAFTCLNLSELDGPSERAFGWSPRVGFVQGIACGFLWDIFDAIINYEGVGFILHGTACLTVYLLGYRPFLAYYGPRFILWELSTPFLNLNWFFERTRMYGSKIHLLNGLALLLSFFSVRLVYGSYMSYNFFKTITLNRDNIPAGLFWTYAVGNVLLNGLNWFWFSKMVNTIRRRFHPSKKPAGDPVSPKRLATNGSPRIQTRSKTSATAAKSIKAL